MDDHRAIVVKLGAAATGAARLMTATAAKMPWSAVWLSAATMTPTAATSATTANPIFPTEAAAADLRGEVRIGRMASATAGVTFARAAALH
jgi:hypothetical protein